MNALTDEIKKVYFRYFAASFGSTLISSIYGIVDMAMVGQYHGPSGSAALGVFAPIWNIIYSFGLLAGIGGSVLFSHIRGRSEGSERKSNEYFTVSVICGAVLSAFVTLLIWFFNEPMFIFFGADETLLPLAQKYLVPIKFTAFFFVFNQLLAAFLRNDGSPTLATVSVLFGGIFNIFGDWFFVFALDMGILGAGIATALGAVLSFLIMLIHFFLKRNTIRFVKPADFFGKVKNVVITGFPTCVTDIAMGVMTILFNRQIMKYLDSDALAVYAIIINIGTFVQCFAYSVGQAAQPVFSLNLGARQFGRIRECLRYAIYTSAVIGILWMAAALAAPNTFVRIFMDPTENVLRIAPEIIRTYGLSFLILPLNVFATFYFQSVMQPKFAFAVSAARGCIVSGIFITLLPAVFGADAIWFAMPLTELIIMAAVIFMMKSTEKNIEAAS